MEPDRPKQRRERFGAAGEQPSDDAGQHITRSRHAQAGAASFIFPRLAVRLDDVALSALDQDKALIARCATPSGRQRVGLEEAVFEYRGYG